MARHGKLLPLAAPGRWPRRLRLGLEQRGLPLPLLELALTLRALLFVGRRYRCPCCGWSVRAFTRGGMSIRSRPAGYCPRCNSKARHRRIWLYLQQRTNVFSERVRLLEVAPKYSFARRFARLPNVDYVGAGLADGPYVSARMDLTAAGFPSRSFDAAICVHVLEEIEDDAAAMSELFRMLKPGGWALVTVPTRMDEATYEDPRITAPRDRRRAFGEVAHVRVYGHDLVDRLRRAGFDVAVDLASDLDEATVRRHGLLRDENVFHCTKPLATP